MAIVAMKNGATNKVYETKWMVAYTNLTILISEELREYFFYHHNLLPTKVPAIRAHLEDISIITNHLIVKHTVTKSTDR